MQPLGVYNQTREQNNTQQTEHIYKWAFSSKKKYYLLRIQSKEISFKLEYEIQWVLSITWEEEWNYST